MGLRRPSHGFRKTITTDQSSPTPLQIESLMVRFLTLALVALLPLESVAELTFDKITPRHGTFGPERASLDIVPGDEIHFSFLVNGVQPGPDGKVDLEFRQVITTETGKVLIDKTSPNKELLAYGGTGLVGFSSFATGTSTPPGVYTVKVTANDLLGKTTTFFERKVTILKPAFATVRRELHHDPDRKSPASTTNHLGHRLYYRLIALGYDRSKNTLDLEMSVQIEDDKKQPTMAKPITVPAASDNAEAVGKTETVTFTGFITTNRPGKFTVKITVTDKVSKQSTTWEFPVTVTE
jgi:hypothetical protein